MQDWLALTGSVAMAALILTAFGLMLGVVKPADVFKYIGAVLGIMIVLMIAPGILVSAWSSMSLWQRLGLSVIGIGFFCFLQTRRQPKKQHHR
jgi:hypothetical protein